MMLQANWTKALYFEKGFCGKTCLSISDWSSLSSELLSYNFQGTQAGLQHKEHLLHVKSLGSFMQNFSGYLPCDL